MTSDSTLELPPDDLDDDLDDELDDELGNDLGESVSEPAAKSPFATQELTTASAEVQLSEEHGDDGDADDSARENSQGYDTGVINTSMLAAVQGFVHGRGESSMSDASATAPPVLSLRARKSSDSIAVAGTTIKQYEMIRPLGSGGMSQVYLARDTRLGRLVALKFLSDHGNSRAQRFDMEAHATARFNHDNVITIYEVGEHDGRQYMALEYVEGQTLAEWLQERRQRYENLAGKRSRGRTANAKGHVGWVVPPRLVIELMLPVVRALVRAHELGIAHRDLKPANIMLTDAGGVKVLDFGVAKLISPQDIELVAGPRASSPGAITGDMSVTQDGFIVGTLPYISPEQLRSTSVDHRTDIWALGIIMYQMVTGQHPLAPFSRHKLRRIGDFTEPMPRVNVLRPDVGPLGSIIDRCLIKATEDRMGSAAELLAELEPIASGWKQLSLDDDESPFTGLSAFQASDSRRFFGRDRDIASMVSRLRNLQIVTIVGPSGTGKSSFVRAGLIPALERSGDAWEAFLLRPGRSPLSALADILSRVSIESGTGVHASDTDDTDDFIERMRAHPSVLGNLLRARARKRLRRILLFVDQFEELYTLSADADERAAFAACLEGVADDAASPLRIVLTLRSDFLDRVAADGARMRVVTRGLVCLPVIGRDGLHEALTRPVEQAGYQFESTDMIEDMLDSLESTGNPLPLLQFTATKLWELRDRERQLLTRDSYDELGGIAGALARHADGVLAGFSPEEQQLVRAIFLNLVTSERTRAIVSMEELRGVAKDGDAAEDVINHLAAARLLLIERDGEGARTGPRAHATVELVHESLIQSWPRLGRWLDMNHDDAEFLARLQNAARLWDSGGRVDGLLWREQAAVDAQRWQERRMASVDLSPRDELYLSAVVSLARRSKIRRRNAAIGAFAGLVAIALVVSFLAIRADRKAVQATLEAARADREAAMVRQQKFELEQEAVHARNATRMSAARELQADPTAVLAILREVEPLTTPMPRGWSALTHWALHADLAEVVLLHPNVVTNARFSPDGERIVTTNFDRVVRVWNADGTGVPQLLRGHENRVSSAVFSPDGAHIASGSSDGTVRVWRADGIGAPIVVRGHSQRISSVAYSPDGSRIASGSADKTIRLWNADGTGDAVVLSGHTDDVTSVEFSADGSRIVSASKDQSARVWRVDGVGEVVVLRGHGHAVNQAVFSPDGRRVATASWDHSARIWNADGTGEARVYTGHGDKVHAIAFSPAGDRIASASWDRTVHLWKPDGTGLARILRGHADILNSVAFGPDGQRVVSASWDGEVRVWDADKPSEPLVFHGHVDRVYSAVFSPDGERILSSSWDKTARVWNADGSGQPVRVGVHGDALTSAAFSPDGRRIVSASDDQLARVWSIDEPGEPVVLRGHAGPVTSAVFSPDGGRIATASDDRTARVWSLASPTTPVILEGHEDRVSTAGFSPDGRHVLTASRDGTVRVWNADGSKKPQVFRGHSDGIVSSSFSPDGRHIITASLDTTARVWRVNGPGAIGGLRLQATLSGHEGPVGLSVRAGGRAFSPDGERIVTASDDNTARVWNADGTGHPVELRGHGEAVNTASFSPDGKRIVTASDDKTIRVWSDLEHLSLDDSRLWRATSYCMPVERRVTLLGVTKAMATADHDRCRARVTGP